MSAYYAWGVIDHLCGVTLIIATRDGNVTISQDHSYAASISHDHYPTEQVRPYPIEKDTDQAESADDENFAEDQCTEGRYVLVKFFTKRGNLLYKYVSQIIESDPLLVEGYKSLNNKKLFKKIPKDISEIDRQDIVAFLP